MGKFEVRGGLGRTRSVGSCGVAWFSVCALDLGIFAFALFFGPSMSVPLVVRLLLGRMVQIPLRMHYPVIDARTLN